MEALESRESEILVEIGKICYFHSYFRRYKQTEQAELGPLPGGYSFRFSARLLPPTVQLHTPDRSNQKKEEDLKSPLQFSFILSKKPLAANHLFDYN